PRSKGSAAETLKAWLAQMKGTGSGEEKIALALDGPVAEAMAACPDPRLISSYDRDLRVVVDREKARFSAWYEMFPRSCSMEPGRHGTFKDCEERLPSIARMGFDVLYLPPIHPIGLTHRKGKNNSPAAKPEDPGSPWAIGSAPGGHKSVHPQLGGIEDFRHLLRKAQEHGIEIALDLAYQCSPDHPYVNRHPEWFRRRPDGSIQYAENPPKKYEDIFPFHFETDAWQALYRELKNVLFFWIEQGVRIFRVDNPHTKPFPFWEWLIGETKKTCPEVIFLAEAFTRPKVMYHLAKLGFSQSYTYFAWRNTQWEIREYFQELTQTEVRDFFRPHLWPNTPDILTEYLQTGGRPGFVIRLILAATLGASYGIYGPAFELCETRAKEFGSEEYLDSEKYEIRTWNPDDASSLKEVIGRVNRIRRENPALQGDWSLRFHPTDNEQILCYSKHTEDDSNIILVVINLDPHHTHGGWVNFPVSETGMEANRSYQVHDLLTNARYLWHGPRNYLELDPRVSPAFVFRLRRRVKTERDFDYFM
ncbi:MAG: alpha-1,4-glucan--maltose-1-phosphate maltosyltransferase, partial [Deltaproteobacteria bacterium]|nr:alpha-1,4-glucan--maltose-1-phosphate maltosyltransferase [Deltaproteobacteria bacterium]